VHFHLQDAKPQSCHGSLPFGQIARLSPGDDLRRHTRGAHVEGGSPKILLLSMTRRFQLLPTAQKQEFLQQITEAA